MASAAYRQPLKAKTAEYFVFGRKAGSWVVAFSILASCIGGSATIGMIGLAWQCGWPAMWWLGSGSVGLALLGLLLARKIRASRCATLPEIVHRHLGPQCRILAAAIIVLSSFAILAAQFGALGLLLASLTGLGFGPAAWLGAFGLFAYTAIGGQKAVMKSDIWQFAVLAGALLAAFMLLWRVPACRLALAQTPPQFFNASLPPGRALYFLLIFGSSFLIGPMIFGRLLSAKSSRCAKNGTLIAAFGLFAMSALITLAGIALAGLNLAPGMADDALFDAFQNALPKWGAFGIQLGLLCAIISSADSCLLTAAIICANDFGPPGMPNPIASARIAMLLLTAASCALVFSGQGILGFLLAASDIYVCGIVGPVLLAILGNIRKNNGGGFLAGMLLGGCCGILAAASGREWLGILGLGLSILPSGWEMYKSRAARKI